VNSAMLPNPVWHSSGQDSPTGGGCFHSIKSSQARVPVLQQMHATPRRSADVLSISASETGLTHDRAGPEESRSSPLSEISVTQRQCWKYQQVESGRGESPPRIIIAMGPSISRPGAPLAIASGTRPSPVTNCECGGRARRRLFGPRRIRK
jgi:hypothetical protein